MNQPLIAVVDDEEDLLENFQSLLEDQFQVATYSSPAAFLSDLSQLQQRGLSLLISDFKMPQMTGLEMVAKAHEQIPNLPFILLSGFLDKKTILEAVDQGAFRLLEKPSAPEELLASIDQLLVESNLSSVRTEIRGLTSKLREAYSTIRLALLQYIPEEMMSRLIVSNTENGNQADSMSFEQLLEHLETRLDQLLKSEQIMHELKTNRWKS